MQTLVFFLEERSAAEMLAGLLPKLISRSAWQFKYIHFEGKQDLEKRLPLKLRAWQQPNCRFIILRDKDSGDCVKIRQKLTAICAQAGKPETLVRIAIHELESWYLGDLAAVETGLNINNLARKQDSRKFRDPDKLTNASEELRKLTSGVYQKLKGSRAIGPHLSLSDNRSASFRKFISGVQEHSENCVRSSNS